MVQHKNTFIIISLVVLFIALGAGGYIFIHHHSKNARSYNDAASNDSPGNNSPGGSYLSVTSSPGAHNLGQLGESTSQSDSNSGLGVGSSSTSPSSSPIDPSTFSQYSKYQNNSTSLFGDVAAGTGTTLGVGQKATITYKGWLTDGTLFDESQIGTNGQLVSLSFTLGSNQIINGLQEAMSGMKVGGTRLIIVPPSLGYGATAKDNIPANSVLVFEVNLLDVQ
jgi:FKBP-type peptidyl-prolyl cis-trans isomerase FkpA